MVIGNHKLAQIQVGEGTRGHFMKMKVVRNGGDD